jgi:hypothetical protein
MHVNPRKRRQKGSLGALRAGLFAMFQRHLEMVEESEDTEVCVKSATVAVQLATAYMRVCELTDLEKGVREVERLAQGNGHLS